MSFIATPCKIISIEGTDGAGKATQTKLLVSALTQAGYKVASMSFPRYDTPTGKAIRRMLTSDESTTISMAERIGLYAADRLAARSAIYRSMVENDFIVMDRYVESMVVYGQALFDIGQTGGPSACNFASSEAVKKFARRLEYKINKMPIPAINFNLLVPPKYSLANAQGRGETDKNDSNIQLQIAVYGVILKQWSKHDNIYGSYMLQSNHQCIDSQTNEMRSPEHISVLLMDSLKQSNVLTSSTLLTTFHEEFLYS